MNDSSHCLYLTSPTPDNEDVDAADVTGTGTITLEAWKVKHVRWVKARYAEPPIPSDVILEAQKKDGAHRIRYEAHRSFGSC